MSSSDTDSAVDTVVLRYFLFVSRIDVLVTILGRPIGVPRTVFDPDEEPGPEETMSEIRRSITVQMRRARDLTRDADARAVAARNAQRLSRIVDFQREGAIVTIDMTSSERQLFGRLTSPTEVQALRLNAPLGMGEAACVAIAAGRGHVLVTDDDDAVLAFDALAPGQRRLRIRSLLHDAGDRGLISECEANRLHLEMRQLGFWDSVLPFPNASIDG